TVLAHMIMAVPYALRAQVSAFLLVPPEYEEAARNLGAGRAYILRKIYLPLIWPGIMAGAIFAFSWSLNEFVLVLLLGYPNIETIPVQIYQFVGGYYLHPQQAAALGLFLLIPTLALMFVAEKTLKSSTVVPAGG
ncbi:MAG: ABC transporter permease subunit, partial [Alphaproteobacteria bacterium]|nr:ABC transporter permease subunit [Alphaproteobacteria bacterium]